MATNVNDLVNYLNIEDTRTGSGSSQLPGGWTKHSPRGGVTINGQYFKGGQFIPTQDLENATPQELEQLNKAIAASQRGESASGVKTGGKFKDASGQNLQQGPPQAPQTIKENVYIIGAGELLGNNNYTVYGQVVLRNNPGHLPKILNADMYLLNGLHSRRFDVILATQVLLIESESGVWPTFGNNMEEDIYSKLHTIKTLKISAQPLDTYSPLGNLEPAFAKLLVPVKEKVVKMCHRKDLHKILDTHMIWKLLKVKKGDMEKLDDNKILQDINLINTPKKSLLADILTKNLKPNHVYTEKIELDSEDPQNELDLLTNYDPFKRAYGPYNKDQLLEDAQTLKKENANTAADAPELLRRVLTRLDRLINILEERHAA